MRNAFLPTVPDRIRLADPRWWEATRETFDRANATEADVYAAAWQLMFDGFLYVVGYHEPDVGWLRDSLDYGNDRIAEHEHAAAESRALFAKLADHTRDRADAPLCIAHCIRDLAYGDESRADDLKAMVANDDPAYREMFERCYWRPTEEEREREEKQEQADRTPQAEPPRRRRKKRQ